MKRVFIWVYTPTGMLIAKVGIEHEQKWLDMGCLVAYMPLSLPNSFEFEFVT